MKMGGRAFIKSEEMMGVNFKGGHALAGGRIPDPDGLIIRR
jgi:hypothetical protein